MTSNLFPLIIIMHLSMLYSIYNMKFFEAFHFVFWISLWSTKLNYPIIILLQKSTPQYKLEGEDHFKLENNLHVVLKF